MDTINLFFDPKSVVLFGATDRPGTVGQVTLKNLLSSQDSRKVYIVHPKHETLMETRCYPKLSTLPEVPELVDRIVFGQVPRRLVGMRAQRR